MNMAGYPRSFRELFDGEKTKCEKLLTLSTETRIRCENGTRGNGSQLTMAVTGMLSRRARRCAGVEGG